MLRTSLLIVLALALAVPVSAQYLPPVTHDEVLDVAAAFMGYRENGDAVYGFGVLLAPHDSAVAGGFELGYTYPAMRRPEREDVIGFWRYTGKSEVPVWVTWVQDVPRWFAPSFGLHLRLENGDPRMFTLAPLQVPVREVGLRPYGVTDLGVNRLILHGMVEQIGLAQETYVLQVEVFNGPPDALGLLAVSPFAAVTPYGGGWIFLGPQYVLPLPMVFVTDAEGWFHWRTEFPQALYGVPFYMQAATEFAGEIQLSNGMKIQFRP